MPIAQLVVQLAAATFHLVQIEQFAFHGRKVLSLNIPGPHGIGNLYNPHTHTQQNTEQNRQTENWEKGQETTKL